MGRSSHTLDAPLPLRAVIAQSFRSPCPTRSGGKTSLRVLLILTSSMGESGRRGRIVVKVGYAQRESRALLPSPPYRFSNGISLAGGGALAPAPAVRNGKGSTVSRRVDMPRRKVDSMGKAGCAAWLAAGAAVSGNLEGAFLAPSAHSGLVRAGLAVSAAAGPPQGEPAADFRRESGAHQTEGAAAHQESNPMGGGFHRKRHRSAAQHARPATRNSTH